MKKIVNLIAIFLVLFLLTFTVNIYALSLDNLTVTTDKEIVHPGENVVLNINFGRDIGSCDVNVDYDDNLLEYVGLEGGTANNTGSQVIISYHYNQQNDPAPLTQMKVTFKARTDKKITTSNPTNLKATISGLGTPEAESIDSPEAPITKNLVVEPVYVDYNIALNYTGNIVPKEEKDMELIISSSMGKNYEHTRIMAEVAAPEGETVKLLATDSQRLEHDIVIDGWGSSEGDPLGGENVSKKLALRGIFSGYGDYTITFKIINRDNSDEVITSKAIKVSVQNPTAEVVPPVTENKPQQEAPSTLPKTGNTIYLSILPIVAILVVAYVALRKKK